MFKSLITPTIDFITGYSSIINKKDFIGRQFKMQQKYVDKRLNEAASLFNRNYYRSYLDTPTARNMLKQVREQLNEQSRAVRNTSVITGATPQAVAAMHQANNKMLDKVVGALSTADVQNKERAQANYEGVRNKLNDYLHGGVMNYITQESKLDDARYVALNRFINPLANVTAELAEMLISGGPQ